METTFAGLTLATAPGRVMTPRPTTESLVAEVLARVSTRAPRVVDVGTGAGGIAIALATALPDADVWATDTSRCAVLLAKGNVRMHGLCDRVSVRHGDLLDPVPGRLDAVVANLPYLPVAEADVHPELAAEPRDAVFSDGDGLGPYRRLLHQCAGRLAPGGIVAIQLRRRVLAVRASELADLTAELAAAA